MNVLIYGVTGYTGRLVVERAALLGMRPRLAGRDGVATRAIAQAHGLEACAFDLADRAALEGALEQVDVVLHLAGPFSATSKPMADACIATGTHYLDITGEIEVFEALAARDGEAKAAGVMLLPGCGFDVVPTDCLALHMKERMPEARALDLVVTGLGRTSRGTAKTAVESLAHGRRARRGGRIVDLAEPVEKAFPFPGGSKAGISVSWGDVSTAFHSTGIPDITVFFEAVGPIRQMARMNPLLRRLLATRTGQAYLKRKIDKRPPGPTPEQRARSFSEILGVARDRAGRELRSLLRTPEGYTLTAMTTLEILRRLDDGAARPGFQTPSLLFGAGFISGFDGCRLEDLD